MPVSQGNFSSGPEGLQLVAWALVTKAGAVVRQSGFSAVNRGAAGNYAFTFSQARPTANYLTVGRNEVDANYATPWAVLPNSKTTAGFTLLTTSAGTPGDLGMVHVAVYE